MSTAFFGPRLIEKKVEELEAIFKREKPLSSLDELHDLVWGVANWMGLMTLDGFVGKTRKEIYEYTGFHRRVLKAFRRIDNPLREYHVMESDYETLRGIAKALNFIKDDLFAIYEKYFGAVLDDEAKEPVKARVHSKKGYPDFLITCFYELEDFIIAMNNEERLELGFRVLRVVNNIVSELSAYAQTLYRIVTTPEYVKELSVLKTSFMDEYLGGGYGFNAEVHKKEKFPYEYLYTCDKYANGEISKDDLYESVGHILGDYPLYVSGLDSFLESLEDFYKDVRNTVEEGNEYELFLLSSINADVRELGRIIDELKVLRAEKFPVAV